MDLKTEASDELRSLHEKRDIIRTELKELENTHDCLIDEFHKWRNDLIETKIPNTSEQFQQKITKVLKTIEEIKLAQICMKQEMALIGSIQTSTYYESDTYERRSDEESKIYNDCLIAYEKSNEASEKLYTSLLEAQNLLTFMKHTVMEQQFTRDELLKFLEYTNSLSKCKADIVMYHRLIENIRLQMNRLDTIIQKSKNATAIAKRRMECEKYNLMLKKQQEEKAELLRTRNTNMKLKYEKDMAKYHKLVEQTRAAIERVHDCT